MTIDEQNLERKFLSLTNSQESVQTLSLWILHHKNHYKKIIQVWLRMLEKSKDKDKNSHRLTMFYLANDVIQNSKKKGCRQYLDGFKEVLKRATQLVKDEKLVPKIERIFCIWSERNVYPEEFINELKQILNGTSTATKTTSKKMESNYANNRVPTDFSLISLEKKAKDIEAIDKASNLLIGNLNLKKIDLINSGILAHLKDKKAGEQCCRELNEIQDNLKAVVSSLQKQVEHRSALLDTLEKCELFYETQNSEVKIVENAYKNFNLRVKGVKNKLNSNKSAYLSPFIDAPSPNSDDDDLLLSDNNNSSGIKNLLNVLNENSSKSNKVSSLDNRLSNLMQNLPVISTLGDNSNQDQHEPNWPTNQTQKQHFNLEQPHNLSHQLPHHPFNSSLINQPPPPPKMNQSHIPPPINVNHPPPFIPNQIHQQPPIMKKHNSHLDPNYYFSPGYPPPPPHLPSTATKQLNDTASSSYEYYNPNKFSQQPNTHSLYNNNSRNTSIQQIKSVVSTRNEQLESNDSSLPYDPYDAVGPNNSMEDFEPTDMDLGNSDDEEMNRSSNSQRFLKVIETNNGNSSNKKPVPAFNNYNNQPPYKQQSSHHQTSIHPQNLHPINPVPINSPITSHLNDFKPEPSKLPPQLPSHITSTSLTAVSNPTSQLSNVQTFHQPPNFYNNKQPQNFNNKFNSPAKGFISTDTRPPLPPGKPRWTNSNHQLLTGSPMNHKPPMFEQHPPINNNNLNSFNNSMNNNQSMSAHNNNQYGSNRHQNNNLNTGSNNNRSWKRNNNKNYHNNQHHHQNNRNRSFSNSSNLSYNSNNNVNLSNLSSVNSISSVVSGGLNHQNQYQ